MPLGQAMECDETVPSQPRSLRAWMRMCVRRWLMMISIGFGTVFIGRAADVPLLSIGDAVPDCALVSDEGRSFQLHELRGQVVAITFIFTRCPLANYCPLMSRHFLSAQRELGREAGGAKKKRWHLLSLSFDPAYDTPAQLRVYGKAQQADASQWTFATAKPGVIALFGASFGLTAFREEGFLNHNLRTVVIDPAGRVQHVFKGNEWKPEELAWEMRKAMAE